MHAAIRYRTSDGEIMGVVTGTDPAMVARQVQEGERLLWVDVAEAPRVNPRKVFVQRDALIAKVDMVAEKPPVIVTVQEVPDGTV